MALPLDTSGAAVTNRIVDEKHSVGTLEERYIIPNKGTFFVNKLKVFNDANGQLLEPVTDYTTLQLNIDASNDTLKETAQIILIKNLEVIRVKLSYQAVGSTEYESIHSKVRPLVQDFISGKRDSKITNAVAGEIVELLPRDFLSTPHKLNDGSMLYVQLNNIAEAISGGDPSAVQAVYEFLINHTNSVRSEYTSKLSTLRNKIDQVFKSTELVNGQYIFTHEAMNPYVYLNYGNWVNNANMLFWGGPAENVKFGEIKNISSAPGLLAMKTMAYRRDDSAPGIQYTLTANKTQVNEGDSVTFTLSAPGLPNGTRISYVLSGVKSTDVVGAQLSGAFVLNASGVGTTTITLVADQVTDGDMNLVLRLVQAPDTFIVVKINDTSQQIKYESYFSSDAAGIRPITTADEGTTAYLQLRTAGLITDRTLFLLYTDSTVNDADTTAAKPTSVVVSDNKATVPYTFRNDFTTEGNETLVVNVCTTQNIATRVVRSVLQVNDTSKTPTLNVFWAAGAGSNESISTINEGQQLFLRIKTTNTPDGSIVNLAYSGKATASDFTNELPITVSILNNEATVQLGVKADGLTEGNELFTATASLADVPALTTSASVTLVDTSVGYTLTSASYSSNIEGTQVVTAATIPSNIYLQIKTKGFANGERVHVDFNDSDASVRALLTSLTAIVQINNDIGTLLITLDDNRGSYTAAGALKAKISLYKDNAISNTLGNANTLTVNPRLIPTAKLTALNESNVSVTQIGEGTTLRIKIDTTNIPNGAAPLPITYSGTASEDDFSTVRPTSVAITNNTATLEFGIKADNKIEGTETFVLTVDLPYGGGKSSIQVSILDTSLPVVNMRWTSDQAGNVPITAVNEGSTAYLQIRTSGFASGTILSLGYSGTVGASDVNGTRPATVVINNDVAVVGYTFANDSLEEGTETMTVSMSYQGTSLNSSASILVNDTSLPGPVQALWSRSASPTSAVGSLVFNEGETAYLHIQTKNLSVGTELQLNYGNSTASASDFRNGLPTVVNVAGEWTTVRYDILEDMVEEAGPNEFLTVTATYRTVSVAPTSTISIVDTSRYELIADGATKDVALAPGASYLVIIQGGGGSGGRSLAKDKLADGEGNGTRGTMSKITLLDGSTEVLNAYAFGGGYGRGVDTMGYPSVADIVKESGGYVLLKPNTALVDGKSPTEFFAKDTYMYPGMDSGDVANLMQTVNLEGLLGNAYTAGVNTDKSLKLPVPTVTKALFTQYGSGGAPGAKLNVFGACGGGAGGTFVGILTNVTSKSLTLRLTSGKGGVTDNTNNNGGVGTSGSPGQPGCVFVTRVAEDYRISTNNPKATLLRASNYKFADVAKYDGNSYPGRKLVIPPGKRVKGTYLGFFPGQDNVNMTELTGFSMAFCLLKADGKVLTTTLTNGRDSGYATMYYTPGVYQNFTAGWDSSGLVRKYFRKFITRSGWQGFTLNEPILGYKQGLGVPENMISLVPKDMDVNDFRQPKGLGYPGNGSLVHLQGEQFTTDWNTGRGWFYTPANRRLNGTPRINVEIENTGNQNMEVAPIIFEDGSGVLEGYFYYVLEDI